MESYTVIGLVHSYGEYNGNSYDNYNIHCTRKSDASKEEIGEITYVFKVKTSLFVQHSISVGDEISPLYDRFGRIVSL